MNFIWIARPVRALIRGLRSIFGAGRSVAQTGGKAAAGEAARETSKFTSSQELLKEELKQFEPQGLETFLFKQLPRPRLTERSASDLTLADAENYAGQATMFYDYNFPLFGHGDFFYEEVEAAFVSSALGKGAHSVDERFLDVMALFRRTLNDNTRMMLVFWAPLIFALSLAAGAYLAFLNAGAKIFAFSGSQAALWQDIASFAAAGAAGLFLIFLFFSWPFKVVQQRNLMNLDNYITSKFARINHNFQVAKRRALNVERNKRMREREELKLEAGAWTMSYHWFAMRLFLCELTIRNKFYQVRRNTTLYWLAGLGLSAAALAIALAGLASAGTSGYFLTLTAASGAALIAGLALILRRVAPMMFRVVEANEWSRFHLLNLHKTVADHVGEDKVQIITFRDRNRFE